MSEHYTAAELEDYAQRCGVSGSRARERFAAVLHSYKLCQAVTRASSAAWTLDSLIDWVMKDMSPETKLAWALWRMFAWPRIKRQLRKLWEIDGVSE